MSPSTVKVPDLATLATSLDAAVHAGGAYLDPKTVQQARMAMERGLERLELGAEHTVVALVGATGSGKSSLFNALAEMEIAEAGARRPLTKHPMACIWGEKGSKELLDWLEVPENRRLQRESVLDADRQAALHGLILLDLPDHDSTEVSHRVEVDRLIGKVDLMVWVVDPQKYADDALHSRYLQKLVDHEGVMLVVLNQIDRLGPDEAETCLRDLRRLLDTDGLTSIRLLAVSARRGDGVEDLRALVADTVRRRTAVVDRSSADLASIAHGLRAGLADGEPDANGAVPGADSLVEELADAAGVPAVLDAMSAEYRRRGWRYTHWPVLQWFRRLSPDALGRLGAQIGEADIRTILASRQAVSAPAQRAQVRLAVETVTGDVATGLPPRWADAVRGSVSGEADLVKSLDDAVATVDLELARPASWRLVWLLQWLLTLVAVAGLIWVFTVGAVQLSGRYLPRPPELLGLPLPVILMIGGLLLGAIVAQVSRWRIARSAARRHEIAEKRIHEVVSVVAHEMVLRPVEGVLRQHRDARRALDGELSPSELRRLTSQATVQELDDDRVVAEDEDLLELDDDRVVGADGPGETAPEADVVGEPVEPVGEQGAEPVESGGPADDLAGPVGEPVARSVTAEPVDGEASAEAPDAEAPVAEAPVAAEPDAEGEDAADVVQAPADRNPQDRFGDGDAGTSRVAV